MSMAGTRQARLLFASSESADMLYATRMQLPDKYLLLESGGKKELFVSDLELGRAKRQAKGCAVRPLRPYKEHLKKSGMEATLPEVLAFILSERRISSVEVPGDFPAWLYAALTAKKFGVTCRRGALFREREVKNKEEERSLAAVQKVNEAALDVCLGMLRESSVKGGKLFLEGKPLTSERIKDELARFYLDKGCSCPDGIIVSCGQHSAMPHHCGEGQLRSGVPLVLDLFPRSMESGYWADMTRTVVKGRAPDKVKRMYNAVLAAQERCLGMIAEGVTGKAVHEEALATLAAHGFAAKAIRGVPTGLIHNTGHGLGLDIHEDPHLSLENDKPLCHGNVVSVEPGLYYPGIGGVRIEDVVIVTKRGCRNLTAAGKVLEMP